MNKKTDNKRREMSKKVENNVKIFAIKLLS